MYVDSGDYDNTCGFSDCDSGGFDNLCGFNHPVMAVNRGIGSQV
jgi:hypothetical protein